MQFLILLPPGLSAVWEVGGMMWGQGVTGQRPLVNLALVLPCGLLPGTYTQKVETQFHGWRLAWNGFPGEVVSPWDLGAFKLSW